MRRFYIGGVASAIFLVPVQADYLRFVPTDIIHGVFQHTGSLYLTGWTEPRGRSDMLDHDTDVIAEYTLEPPADLGAKARWAPVYTVVPEGVAPEIHYWVTEDRYTWWASGRNAPMLGIGLRTETVQTAEDSENTNLINTKILVKRLHEPTGRQRSTMIGELQDRWAPFYSPVRKPEGVQSKEEQLVETRQSSEWVTDGGSFWACGGGQYRSIRISTADLNPYGCQQGTIERVKEENEPAAGYKNWKAWQQHLNQGSSRLNTFTTPPKSNEEIEDDQDFDRYMGFAPPPTAQFGEKAKKSIFPGVQWTPDATEENPEEPAVKDEPKLPPGITPNSQGGSLDELDATNPKGSEATSKKKKLNLQAASFKDVPGFIQAKTNPVFGNRDVPGTEAPATANDANSNANNVPSTAADAINYAKASQAAWEKIQPAVTKFEQSLKQGYNWRMQDLNQLLTLQRALQDYAAQKTGWATGNIPKLEQRGFERFQARLDKLAAAIKQAEEDLETKKAEKSKTEPLVAEPKLREQKPAEVQNNENIVREVGEAANIEAQQQQQQQQQQAPLDAVVDDKLPVVTADIQALLQKEGIKLDNLPLGDSIPPQKSTTNGPMSRKQDLLTPEEARKQKEQAKMLSRLGQSDRDRLDPGVARMRAEATNAMRDLSAGSLADRVLSRSESRSVSREPKRSGSLQNNLKSKADNLKEALKTIQRKDKVTVFPPRTAQPEPVVAATRARATAPADEVDDLETRIAKLRSNIEAEWRYNEELLDVEKTAILDKYKNNLDDPNVRQLIRTKEREFEDKKGDALARLEQQIEDMRAAEALRELPAPSIAGSGTAIDASTRRQMTQQRREPEAAELQRKLNARVAELNRLIDDSVVARPPATGGTVPPPRRGRERTAQDRNIKRTATGGFIDMKKYETLQVKLKAFDLMYKERRGRFGASDLNDLLGLQLDLEEHMAHRWPKNIPSETDAADAESFKRYQERIKVFADAVSMAEKDFLDPRNSFSYTVPGAAVPENDIGPAEFRKQKMKAEREAKAAAAEQAASVEPRQQSASASRTENPAELALKALKDISKTLDRAAVTEEDLKWMKGASTFTTADVPRLQALRGDLEKQAQDLEKDVQKNGDAGSVESLADVNLEIKNIDRILESIEDAQVQDALDSSMVKESTAAESKDPKGESKKESKKGGKNDRKTPSKDSKKPEKAGKKGAIPPADLSTILEAPSVDESSRSFSYSGPPEQEKSLDKSTIIKDTNAPDQSSIIKDSEPKDVAAPEAKVEQVKAEPEKIAVIEPEVPAAAPVEREKLLAETQFVPEITWRTDSLGLNPGSTEYQESLKKEKTAFATQLQEHLKKFAIEDAKNEGRFHRRDQRKLRDLMNRLNWLTKATLNRAIAEHENRNPGKPFVLPDRFKEQNEQSRRLLDLVNQLDAAVTSHDVFEQDAKAFLRDANAGSLTPVQIRDWSALLRRDADSVIKNAPPKTTRTVTEKVESRMAEVNAVAESIALSDSLQKLKVEVPRVLEQKQSPASQAAARITVLSKLREEIIKQIGELGRLRPQGFKEDLTTLETYKGGVENQMRAIFADAVGQGASEDASTNRYQELSQLARLMYNTAEAQAQLDEAFGSIDTTGGAAEERRRTEEEKQAKAKAAAQERKQEKKQRDFDKAVQDEFASMGGDLAARLYGVKWGWKGKEYLMAMAKSQVAGLKDEFFEKIPEALELIKRQPPRPNHLTLVPNAYGPPKRTRDFPNFDIMKLQDELDKIWGKGEPDESPEQSEKDNNEKKKLLGSDSKAKPAEAQGAQKKAPVEETKKEETPKKAAKDLQQSAQAQGITKPTQDTKAAEPPTTKPPQGTKVTAPPVKGQQLSRPPVPPGTKPLAPPSNQKLNFVPMSDQGRRWQILVGVPEGAANYDLSKDFSINLRTEDREASDEEKQFMLKLIANGLAMRRKQMVTAGKSLKIPLKQLEAMIQDIQRDVDSGLQEVVDLNNQIERLIAQFTRELDGHLTNPTGPEPSAELYARGGEMGARVPPTIKRMTELGASPDERPKYKVTRDDFGTQSMIKTSDIGGVGELQDNLRRLENFLSPGYMEGRRLELAKRQQEADESLKRAKAARIEIDNTAAQAKTVEEEAKRTRLFSLSPVMYKLNEHKEEIEEARNWAQSEPLEAVRATHKALAKRNEALAAEIKAYAGELDPQDLDEILSLAQDLHNHWVSYDDEVERVLSQKTKQKPAERPPTKFTKNFLRELLGVAEQLKLGMAKKMNSVLDQPGDVLDPLAAAELRDDLKKQIDALGKQWNSEWIKLADILQERLRVLRILMRQENIPVTSRLVDTEQQLQRATARYKSGRRAADPNLYRDMKSRLDIIDGALDHARNLVSRRIDAIKKDTLLKAEDRDRQLRKVWGPRDKILPRILEAWDKEADAAVGKTEWAAQRKHFATLAGDFVHLRNLFERSEWGAQALRRVLTHARREQDEEESAQRARADPLKEKLRQIGFTERGLGLDAELAHLFDDSDDDEEEGGDEIEKTQLVADKLQAQHFVAWRNTEKLNELQDWSVAGKPGYNALQGPVELMGFEIEGLAKNLAKEIEKADGKAESEADAAARAAFPDQQDPDQRKCFEAMRKTTFRDLRRQYRAPFGPLRESLAQLEGKMKVFRFMLDEKIKNTQRLIPGWIG